MPTLLITRRLPDRVLDAARARFDVTLRDEENRVLSPDELRAALRDYDVCAADAGRPLLRPRSLPMCRSPARRMLANFGVGYNHIDVAAARAAGVIVTNTPGAVTDATADIALTLILMTARRAGEGERLLRAGKWEGWGPTQMLGLPCDGQARGHHRHGPDRQGHRPALPCGLRHGGGVPQPLRRGRSGRARAAGAAGRGDGARISSWWPCRAGPATHHLIDADGLCAR